MQMVLEEPMVWMYVPTTGHWDRHDKTKSSLGLCLALRPKILLPEVLHIAITAWKSEISSGADLGYQNSSFKLKQDLGALHSLSLIRNHSQAIPSDLGQDLQLWLPGVGTNTFPADIWSPELGQELTISPVLSLPLNGSPYYCSSLLHLLTFWVYWPC